ncbi:serine hydrolase domain-containing protein [Mucilaginibacter segetis]|uniref:Serine hydrolase n=1 Tax=Mucilaginibacter segetis TaxID=2793071 RepID=A0A934PR97_9SPHI|nr:serine hydrolase [Mucilaginibacter segetis]MBK0377985.1 serine hydrolase [Mucilaginibacter segetis]
MRGNKRSLVCVLFLGFIIFNSACAQNPPLTGKAYLKEQTAVEQSTVLLNNEKQLIPIQNLNDLKAISIHFSDIYAHAFDSLLNKYTQIDTLDGTNYLGAKSIGNLDQDTRFYNMLIIQLTDADLNNQQILNFITTNEPLKNVIIYYWGNGSSLIKLNNINAPIIWSSRVSPVAALYSAQAVFGGVPITQRLKKNYSTKYKANAGFLTTKIRLQYTVPEDAGIKSENLLAIDDIAREAISNHATPGCVVLVARDGKVIFNKAYGFHTYSNEIPERITDIFDLASMTKISATTMEAMQLYDLQKLNLDSTAGTYLALARNTNKKDLTVREILEHQAGLIPDIATFEKVKPSDHSADSSASYPTKVNDGYYLRKNYFEDVMWPDMLNSPVRTRGKYVYSDLSMCFMQQIEETLTSTPLNDYVKTHFYDPLGMQDAGFLPLYRFSASQIPPTENDREYRHALLDGYVHDPTAALMGGVAGHAGLFANTNDLAILYQMMLNRGSYGGIQYIKPETVDLFTAKQSDVSRRGLGFDRWDPVADHNYPSKLASSMTYGHTGFTGTCVWVDPKYNLVYVFLSNRVHPNVGNKLGTMNIRPRIQDAIYEAINKGL